MNETSRKHEPTCNDTERVLGGDAVAKVQRADLG